MAEVIIVLAIAVLLFMSWQLYRARQYNRFLDWLKRDIEPQVVNSLMVELEQSRSALFPNNEAHQQATIYYYTYKKVRIFQAACAREIISKEWLQVPANQRLAQHLMHSEQAYRI